MKVKANNKIFDVSDYFSIKNKHLFNNNTHQYEGVDGDFVIARGLILTVKQYTEHQIIPTYEIEQTIVLSIEELPQKRIFFNNIVEYN